MDESEVRAARQLREHFPTFAKLLRIKTKDGSVVPFELNKAQKELWKCIQKMEAKNLPVRIIILKARQLGMSTFVQAYLLWKAVTRPGHNGLVVAHQEDAAMELFGKIEMMYRLLPDGLHADLENIKDTTRKGKKLAFAGDLNTLLYVDTANNPALGRGQTFQHVHLSEMAFYAKPDDIMFGLAQSVPNKPGTTIIIESTANGMGNYFHNMWERSKTDDSSYEPLFLPWCDDPDYRLPIPDDFKLTSDERKLKKRYKLDNHQIMWRRASIMDGCDGDVEKFQQENPIDEKEAFLISGLPYFERSSLLHYRSTTKEPLREGDLELENGKPLFIDREGGTWRIWRRPLGSRSYCVGADVAGGGARDFSAAHVLDTESLEVVASFHGKLDPHDFARQLKWIGLAYNKALVAVERNGEGRATVLKMINDLHYPRMFYHTTEESWNGGVQRSWGWSTNSRTRPAMIAQLRAIMRERQLKLYDDRTLVDLESFVRVENSKIATAANGAWDDLVMSLAIACSSEVRSQGAAFMEFDAGPPPVPTVSEITGY